MIRPFDPSYYRRQNADLAALADDELASHFEHYGRKEGRPGTPFAVREHFVTLIDSAAEILEIGPFDKPVVSGPRVRYFDVLDRSGLIQRAKAIGFDWRGVPEIHYVSPTGDLSVVDHPFDAIVSSHCIEHQPDLVRHLRDVGERLKLGGRYFLLVPDKRYCFDHFLPESRLSSFLTAHLEGRGVHAMQSVIEHRAFLTHNDSVRHWSGDHGNLDGILDKARRAADEWRRADGAYIDVHAWQFTPDSLSDAVDQFAALGLIDLAREHVFPTPWGRFEFCAILRRC